MLGVFFLWLNIFQNLNYRLLMKEETLGYHSLANKYTISSKSQIEHGLDSINKKGKNG